MNAEFKNVVNCNGVRRENVMITFDEDFNIPDKKNDVDEVLWMESSFTDVKVKCEGNKARISGNFSSEIMYRSSENGCIECAVALLPVSQWTNLTADCTSCSATVKIEDCSARIINSRKLNLRALISCEVCCEEDTSTDVITDINAPIEKRYEDINISTLVADKSDYIKVNEIVTIPNNKPNIDEILFSKVTLKDRGVRLMENSFVVKGDLETFVLYSYTPEGEDRGQLLTYHTINIPFEETLNLTGLTESDTGFILADVCYANVTVVPDDDGEERRIKVDADISLGISAYRDENVTILKDAYSLTEDVELGKKKSEFALVNSHNASRLSITEDLSCEPYLQLCYSDAFVQVDETTYTDDGIRVNGAVGVKIMGIKDKDQNPVGVMSYTLPFEHVVECRATSGNRNFRMCPYVDRISVNLAGDNTINVRLSIIFDTCIFDTFMVDAVTEVVEREVQGKDNTFVIKGIITGPSDTLWDIAKTYRTTVESIMNANGLTSEDVSAGRKLIIEPVRKHMA